MQLPETASPSPWAQLSEGRVEVFRNLKCKHYEKCLYLAAVDNWPGFTCKYCLNYVDKGLEKLLAILEEED